MPTWCACVLAGFLSAQPAREAELLDLLPAESAAAVWWRLNPERAFMSAHFERALARANEAKVGESILELIEQVQGVQARLGVQGGSAMLGALLGQIEYGNLLAEVACSWSLAPQPAAMLVCRPRDPERAFKELAACLGTLARMAGQIVTVTNESEWRIVYASTRAPGVELWLAKQDGLVVAASSKAALVDLDERKAGRKAGLRANAKWRAAAAQLPRPEDAAYFLDLETLGRACADLLAGVRLPDGPAGQKVALEVFRDIIDRTGLCRLGSYAAGVSWTEGRVFRSASVSAMSGAWRETPLGKMLAGSECAWVPLERVPGDATAVSFQAGLDPAPVTEAVLAVLRQHLGEERVDGFCKEFREGLGVDPAEVVRMFTASQLQYQVKGSKQALFGQVDQSVLMLGVRNAEALQRVLGTFEREVLAKELREFLRVEKLEGFPSICCARFNGLPLGALAWGIHGDTFYFGTDSDVLAACLRGGDPAGTPFLWRDDVRALGTLPSGPVFAFSYIDLGRFIVNLSQVCTMGGIGAAFVPAGDPRGDTARRVFALIPRFAAVLRSMDFFGGMASTTTFDPASGRFLTVEAIEVKDSAPQPAPAAPAETPRRETF